MRTKVGHGVFCLILLLATRAGFSQAPASTTTPSTRSSAAGICIVTSNIRNSGADDGVNGWGNRRGPLIAEMRKLDPDLLGTQEVLADQFDDLSKALGDRYHIVGVGREDGKRKGEFSAIFVRKSRFDLLDSGTFWLSETPDVVASKGWDAALERICTWGRLHDRVCDRDLLFANTHFDHVGMVAREQSARLLASKLPLLAKHFPIILTGDFNSTEDSSAYAVLTKPHPEGVPFIDTFRELKPERNKNEASFNGWKEAIDGSRIDWILKTSQFVTEAAEIDRTRAADGVFLSDHYLVTAQVEWRSQIQPPR